MAVARSYREGWLTSLKIDQLGNDSAELFLFRLGLKADKNGVYHGEPELLRTAVYPLQVSRRRLADVTRYRDMCARAGLLRLYVAADGRPYVQILKFDQKTPNEKPLHPLPPGEPDDTGQQKLGLAEPEPPPPRARRGMKLKEREVSGADAAPGTHDTRLAELCLDELQAKWPKHDVRACLRDATRYARGQRGGDAAVTVDWFNTRWMPKAAEKKPEAKPEPRAIISQTASDEEAAKVRAEWRKMPEPPAGTLEHAMWQEAHRTS
jgi:hypothetical protein